MQPTTYDWRQALAVALRTSARIEFASDDAPFVLETLSSQRLLALDGALRRIAWAATLPGPVRPVFAGAIETERDPQLFCLGTHRDGHLRERALRLGRERAGPLMIALALIRCDDWVDQVRETAEETLRLRLAADPACLFAHIDLLLALRGRQRFDTGAWRVSIEPALLHPAHRAQRWTMLESGVGKARLFACTLIQRADADRGVELALRAVRDRDPVIARWALRELSSPPGAAADESALDDVALSHALRHPSASVRAQALRIRGRRSDAAYAALIHNALLDASTTVRSVAIHAAQALDIDARRVFREAIDRGDAPGSRNALLALADCADSEDLSRLRSWLHHPNRELRCAALRGALRAGIENPAAVLREALTATSGKVVKYALALGETVPGFMIRDTLSAAFAAAANDGNRRRLLAATRRIDRWSALECIIDCIAHTRSGDDAERALHAWAYETGNRFALLSEARRQALLTRIDAMTPPHKPLHWMQARRVVEAG